MSQLAKFPRAYKMGTSSRHMGRRQMRVISLVLCFDRSTTVLTDKWRAKSGKPSWSYYNLIECLPFCLFDRYAAMLTRIAAHQRPFSIELGPPITDVSFHATISHCRIQAHLPLISKTLEGLQVEIISELIKDGRTLAYLRIFHMTKHIDQIQRLSRSQRVNLAHGLSEPEANQLVDEVNKEYMACAIIPSLRATSLAIKEWAQSYEEYPESNLPFWQTPLVGTPRRSLSLHPDARVHRE
jgi:hypothetical protein